MLWILKASLNVNLIKISPKSRDIVYVVLWLFCVEWDFLQPTVRNEKF